MTKAVPYFPLYAANLIASKPYRLMNLEQRGLWISILMECWVNGAAPSNPKDMAKYLGFSNEEISNAFSSLHYSYFEESDNQFVSRELEEYRQSYLDRRELQRLAGIEGAQRKKAKQSKEAEERRAEGTPKGSLSYINSSSVSSNQLINKEDMSEELKGWVNDYEDSPDLTNQYLKASKGD